MLKGLISATAVLVLSTSAFAGQIYSNKQIAELASMANEAVGPSTGGFAITEKGEAPRAGCVMLKRSGDFAQWNCLRAPRLK